MNKVLK